MKILIIDPYYLIYLTSLYKRRRIKKLSYDEQVKTIFAECFGTADFYSRHLKVLGIDAVEIITNSVPLQLRWAQENGFRINGMWLKTKAAIQRVPIAAKVFSPENELLEILTEQVRRLKPDVLYFQDLSFVPPKLLRSFKSYVRLIVGQIACPLPPDEYLAEYNLILTSFPHFVERFRSNGIASEYFRLAFEPSVLDRIGSQKKKYTCTFVGGISETHKKGSQLLEHIARNVDADFFGYGKNTLRKSSSIRKRHHGEVWGLEMYRTLARSHITINRHIDVAENYANNMRLFEATGCGAMLLTDAKDNLGELFEVGTEVVTYSSPQEAVELIQYYTAHPAERDAIAKAGQARTLREHTYMLRMKELASILSRYLPISELPVQAIAQRYETSHESAV